MTWLTLPKIGIFSRGLSEAELLGALHAALTAAPTTHKAGSGDGAPPGFTLQPSTERPFWSSTFVGRGVLLRRGLRAFFTRRDPKKMTVSTGTAKTRIADVLYKESSPDSQGVFHNIRKCLARFNNQSCSNNVC